MPRVYTSESNPIDFCNRCFPDEEIAFEKYGNLGDGPDDRGNCFEHDAEHPSYDETDYVCEDCKNKLTDKDN